MSEVFQKTSKKGYRYYIIKKDDGREFKVPSVTTVIGELDKPQLVPWAVGLASRYISEHLSSQAIESQVDLSQDCVKDIFIKAKSKYKEISKEATDVGGTVHWLIEEYLKKGTKPLFFSNDSIKNGFNAFLDWERDNDFKFIESEKQVFHDEIMVAGTTDCICTIRGKKYIIDFKTSKDMYFPSFGMQLSAYKLLYDAMNVSGKIEGIGVVRLDKSTGIPEWKDYTENYEKYLKMFLNILSFYGIKNEVKEAEKCSTESSD